MTIETQTVTTESIDTILTWLDASPSTARYIAAAGKLERLNAEGLGDVRVALLRNFTIDPIVPYLKVKCFRAGLKPSVYVGPFDGVQQDAFDDNSPLYRFDPNVIALALRLHTLTPDLIFNFASLSEADVDSLIAATLSRCTALIGALRARSSAMILVHGFELAHSPAYGIIDAQTPYGQQNAIRRLNAELAKYVSGIASSYLIDVDHLVACVGYDNGIDDRYWHIGRAPYASSLLDRIAAEYVAFTVALKGKSRKCLVLDCDNTLWGGIIGEDGMNGIALGTTHPGSGYREMHAAALDLYHRGILLALNSKNNEADAMQVFSEHTGTLLKPEHFAAKRINWQDKATNLREIAQELNIGMDSLVFVDDNPVECEYIRQALPQVVVIQVPSDSTQFRRTLQSFRFFDTLTISEEDRRRTSMYKKQSQRAELERSSGSLEDYLRSLEMVLTIGTADTATSPRIAQLTQKTNQFNVTTRRYTEDDIRKFSDDPAVDVYWARLCDRFDDNGIIAVAIVRYNGADAEIDTLLMSCRVIGRGVEQALLAHLAQSASARGCARLLGEFIRTAKNDLAANLFAANGFAQPADEQSRWWVLPLDLELPSMPDWLSSGEIKENS